MAIEKRIATNKSVINRYRKWNEKREDIDPNDLLFEILPILDLDGYEFVSGTPVEIDGLQEFVDLIKEHDNTPVIIKNLTVKVVDEQEDAHLHNLPPFIAYFTDDEEAAGLGFFKNPFDTIAETATGYLEIATDVVTSDYTTLEYVGA